MFILELCKKIKKIRNFLTHIFIFFSSSIMGLANSKFNSYENHEYNKNDTKEGKYEPDEIHHTPQNNKNSDPRSPNVYRTPLTHNDGSVSPSSTAINAIPITKQLNLTTDNSILLRPPANGLLKAMLLRDLDQNSMLDPRSPNQFIQRTPLHLKSSKSTVLTDDSFDCSLIEDNAQDTSYTALSTSESASLPTEPLQLADNIEESLNAITLTEPKEFLETNFDTSDPVELIIACDPRSPSLNVDRTPLLLNTVPAMSDLLFERLSEPENVTIVEKTPVTSKKVSSNHLIYEDENVAETEMRPSATKALPKVRTPLGCLGNTVSLVNKSRTPKHPVLFIEEQQQLAFTPKNHKSIAKRLSTTNSSKIPIFKSK